MCGSYCRIVCESERSFAVLHLYSLVCSVCMLYFVCNNALRRLRSVCCCACLFSYARLALGSAVACVVHVPALVVAVTCVVCGTLSMWTYKWSRECVLHAPFAVVREFLSGVSASVCVSVVLSMFVCVLCVYFLSVRR